MHEKFKNRKKAQTKRQVAKNIIKMLDFELDEEKLLRMKMEHNDKKIMELS